MRYSNTKRISSSDVFVVSGGARGITADCVIALGRRYQCRFVLIGRTLLDDEEPSWAQGIANETDLRQQATAFLQDLGEQVAPIKVQQMVTKVAYERDIRTTLRAIAETGAQAEYLCVDITDRTRLMQVLGPFMHRAEPITGIIHSAGVLSDKLIERKTAADFDRVYDVKIAGLSNLLACIPAKQLDYLILFSSIAGFYGNVGQADYAIANETLNKIAHKFKQLYPQCRVICFDWGPWDGGMVTAELKHLFEQYGISVILRAAGAQALVDELEADLEDVQVLIGSPLETTNVRLSPILDMLRARRAIMDPTRSVLEQQRRSYRVRRTLALDSNPTLADHSIGGHAVLPASFGMQWIAGTCEQLYPGHLFFSCERYQVLKGIVLDHNLAPEHVLDITELTIDEAAGEVCVEATIWSQTDDQFERYHYRGQFTLRRRVPTAPIYTEYDLTDMQSLSGAEVYQNGALFHGPAFQGIIYILNLDAERLTMSCVAPKIAPNVQGQFPIRFFNPYAADICVQSMPVWMYYQHGASVLPISMERFEHYRAVPPGTAFYVSLEVRVVTDYILTADLIAHDAVGQIYFRAIGSEGAISSRLNQLFLPHHKVATLAAQSINGKQPPHRFPNLLGNAEALEHANGQVANVFGANYAAIDAFPRRVRLPSPPYLFVSRVLHLDAMPGNYRACSITTEYDIPSDAWYAVDGQTPCAILAEAGQGILLLLSYLGVDLKYRGQFVYRQLDDTLIFLDTLPQVGQTLRYEISINSFVNSESNELVFSRFNCYADGRLILRMEDGCAGFFSDADLLHSHGITRTDEEHMLFDQIKQQFAPLLVAAKHTFEVQDLQALCNGDIALCFGDAYQQYGLNPFLRLGSLALMHITRVALVDPGAGRMGLGRLIAYQDVDPEDWYFDCHFKNDPVLPGSVITEVCYQLLRFAMLYFGLQVNTRNARFEPVVGLRQSARFRGQVSPQHITLMYQMDITDIGSTPEPYAISCVDMLLDDKVIATFSNIGLRLVEQLG
jgi:3-hydroxymyristoyl/3-hydroxydecanoyl-(acyl carrier protein) dehydratase/NADP-dependent 3-hydroxy acid dehydrogenase YdfG